MSRDDFETNGEWKYGTINFPSASSLVLPLTLTHPTTISGKFRHTTALSVLAADRPTAMNLSSPTTIQPNSPTTIAPSRGGVCLDATCTVQYNAYVRVCGGDTTRRRNTDVLRYETVFFCHAVVTCIDIFGASLLVWFIRRHSTPTNDGSLLRMDASWCALRGCRHVEFS